MKASIVLEVIGGDIRGAAHWKARKNPRLRATPDRTWVAEIVGLDPRYVLRREFVRYSQNYYKANSVASRGVERCYVLESGRVYEVQRFVTWQRMERYFCRISESGDVERITEEDARVYADQLDATAHGRDVLRT